MFSEFPMYAMAAGPQPSIADDNRSRRRRRHHHDHHDRHGGIRWTRRTKRKLRKAQVRAMVAEHGAWGPWAEHLPSGDEAPWAGAGPFGHRGARGAGRGARGGWDDTGRGDRGRGEPRGRGRSGPGWAGRGGRMRRGDVRAAILALLLEEPRHGYDLMQELADRTNGLWRPSPGSVYPTLAQLEDEGLITAREENGKRVFTLTDAGRVEAGQHEGPAPWDEVNDAVDGRFDRAGEWNLMREAALVMAAAKQFRHLASPDQREAAVKVLADARRHLYRLLAVDPDE